MWARRQAAQHPHHFKQSPVPSPPPPPALHILHGLGDEACEVGVGREADTLGSTRLRTAAAAAVVLLVLVLVLVWLVLV